MASSMGPAKMVTDGLLLHLDAGNVRSYPGSGTSWNNLISMTPTGSFTNGTTFSSANGGSVVLDGTDDNVNLGNNSALKPSLLTISMWVSPTTSSKNQVLFDGGYQGSNVGYLMYINSNDTFSFWVRNTRGNNNQGDGVRTVSSSLAYTTSSWYNITGVYDGTNCSFYLNGILQQTESLPSPIAYTTSNVWIGNYVSFPNIGLAYKGSVGTTLLYNRALSANEVFQNYEATRERFNRPTIVTDDDARNFLNSANISDETQQRAVNDLVVDMKNAGLWGKMKAIYPFVGGTAASHKWNLKDPRDLDAAFRLTFSGGWTHSSTGAKANGTNGYANTYLSANTMGQNSVHLSVYIRENISGFMADIGHVGNSSQNTAALDIFTREGVLLPTTDSFTAYGLANQTNALVGIRAAVSTSAGHTMVTRISSTLQSLYKNGLSIGTSTNTSVSPTSNVIYISALNFVALGTIDYYSSRQVALATIGDGLTDTDASNLYTIVQKYQTTLGRQV